MSIRNFRLRSCVCGVLAAAAVNGAWAQEKPAVLEEIFVTAQKRSETLQDVSISLTVVTEKTRDLIGIKTVQDLTDFTPGITYQTSLDRMTVRGIGRLTNNLSTDPGVATYVDGVFNSSNWSGGVSPLFFDRIEFLRGPQGTLYGRNSIGGAMNVVGKRPAKEFAAEIRVAKENYDRQVVEGRVTGPLTDWLRVSVGGNSTKQHEGWFQHVNGSSEGGVKKDDYMDYQISGNVGTVLDLWAKYTHWNVNRSERSNGFQPQTAVVTPYDIALFPPQALTPSSTYCPAAGPCDLGARPSVADHRAYAATFQNDVSDPVDTYMFEAIGHLGWADLKYIGGYTNYLYFAQSDNNGTNRASYVYRPTNTRMAPVTIFADNRFNYLENKKYYSNELNLISTGDGPLQWIVGAYQYHEQYDQWFSFSNPSQPQLAFQLVGATLAPNPGNEVYRPETFMNANSKAAFAQVDWNFTESLKATVGVRYTRDEKAAKERFTAVAWGLPAFYPPAFFLTPYGLTGAYELNGGIYTTPGGPTIIPNSATPPLSVATFLADPSGNRADPTCAALGCVTRFLAAEWSSPTGTVGLEWKPSEDMLTYFKFTRGYKAGGFNSGTIDARPYTDPEHVNAYEIGLKQDVTRQLQVNVAAFFYNYEGAQVPVTVVPPGGGPSIGQTVNLDKAKSMGLEIESIWNATSQLQFNFSYSYLKATIESGCCYVDPVDPLGLDPKAKRVALTTTGEWGQSVDGNSLSGSPRNKFAVAGNYRFDFSPGSLTLVGTYAWRDEEYYGIFNRAYNQAPSYGQAGLRALWNANDNRYSVIAYINNLTDEEAYDNHAGALTSTGTVSSTYTLIPPRTYGLELQYRFGSLVK